MAGGQSGGELKRAKIRVLNGSAEGEEIECLFNPSEYDVSRSVKYSERGGSGSSSYVQQFVEREAETLSMELFFDTSETQADVREEYTKNIDELLSVDSELHAPPLVEFRWGSLNFKALLESADKSFTRFLPSGKPVRARVSVTFREYRDETEADEIKLESTDKTKAWTVTEGDTLWLIAAEEYGDPAHWRTIADANAIEDPRRLETGSVLELPPL